MSGDVLIPVMQAEQFLRVKYGNRGLVTQRWCKLTLRCGHEVFRRGRTVDQPKATRCDECHARNVWRPA